jgi:hypothetical protein
MDLEPQLPVGTSNATDDKSAGACDPYLTFSTIPAEFTLNHKVGRSVCHVWMDR